MSTTFLGTPVSGGDFEEPVVSMNHSGGTAAFVALTPLPHSRFSSKGIGYYIGKDITHARSETSFYDSATTLDLHKWRILRHMLEFVGVYRMKFAVDDTRVVNRDFIVMENLFHGRRATRLIDVKIGAITSDKNWRGKGCFAAWRNHRVEKVTNSDHEGYRLEGIDNPPNSLISITPFALRNKRTQRFLYQRLPGSEFLDFFLDLSHLELPSDFPLSDSLSPVEYSMLLHLDLIVQLRDILRDALSVPIPQKWLSSSTVVTFDAARAPRRSDVTAAGSGMRVHLLDWGRSELTTPQSWSRMSPWAKADRVKFWTQYRDAMCRLLYEAARMYFCKYASTMHVDSVNLDVFDYDALSKDDFIGRVVIPLADFSSTEFGIADLTGKPVKDWRGRHSLLTVSVRQYAVDGIVNGFYRIRIDRATNLPRMDFLINAFCDGFVRVKSNAGADLGRTPVCDNCADPEWNAVVDVPIVRLTEEKTKLVNALGIGPTNPIGAKPGQESEFLHEIFASHQSGHEINNAARRLMTLHFPEPPQRTRSMRY